MTRLVTVAPSSIRRFMDVHKSEILICVRVPVGFYLLYCAVALIGPWAFYALQAGNSVAFVWGIFYLALAVVFVLLGVKLIVTAALQFLMLKSLKSMQFAKTKRLCLQAVALLSRWPLVRGAELTFFEVGLGAVCMARADYEEAEGLFAAAIDRYRKYMTRFRLHNKVRHTPNMVVLLSHLARSQAAQGKFAQAEQAARESLELARSVNKKAYARLEVFPLSAIGYAHLRSGALEEAEQEYTQVLKVYDQTPALPSYGSTALAPILMAATMGLAIISIKKGNAEESLKHWSNFVEREGQSSTPMSPSFLRSYNVLANEYMNNRFFTEAEKVLDMAYSLALHHFDHPDAKETLSYFEKLLLLTDRQAEVGDMRAWLRLSQTR